MHAARQARVSCLSAQFEYDRWGAPPKWRPRLGASTPTSAAAKLAPLGQGRRIILHVSEGAHEVLTAPCRFRSPCRERALPTGPTENAGRPLALTPPADRAARHGCALDRFAFPLHRR